MGWRQTFSLVVLALLAALTFLIGGLSIWFVEDAFEHDARVLITTFAAGMTVLAMLVLFTAYRQGARWAWAAMWVYPAFFLSHVIMLGTYIPDLILAAVAAGALLLTADRMSASHTAPG